MNKIQSFFTKIGDWPYYQALSDALKNCNSVLDVGCGSWSPLSEIKKHFYAEGIDIHKPSLEKAKKNKVHDKYRLGDVKKLDKFYQPKSFDAVVALDLIEHLPKNDGLKLIKKMESIARKTVILLTPNGFTKQDPLEDNPHQVHQSGWGIGELRKLGYRVYGMRGLKFLRGECATIRFKPWFFWGLISTLSELITYFFPDFSYQLLAIKEVSSGR